jgi:hypothetical protein
MREMSDTTTESHIIALKMRVRDLELQAVEVKARYEEALATLEMLEHPSHGSHPRRPRGRPRKPEVVLASFGSGHHINSTEPETAA